VSRGIEPYRRRKSGFQRPISAYGRGLGAQGRSQHPHRGIETVTLVLDGALEHFDSAGNTGVIYAGGAQWMTAAVA
jgi:redox-sensitive bicupin YhaK (pirin superfamily)